MYCFIFADLSARPGHGCIVTLLQLHNIDVLLNYIM